MNMPSLLQHSHRNSCTDMNTMCKEIFLLNQFEGNAAPTVAFVMYADLCGLCIGSDMVLIDGLNKFHPITRTQVHLLPP